MKTWNEIIETRFYDYIWIDIKGIKGSMKALFLDGVRLDYSTVPEGLFPYAVRHTDDDWTEPATVERAVLVNFLGTIIVKHELDLGDKGYLEVLGWGMIDGLYGDPADKL